MGRWCRIVLLNLKARKARGLISVLGTGVCIFIFAAIQSLDQGLGAMIDTSGGERVLIVFERYKACPPFSRLPSGYAEAVGSVPGVEDVMAMRFLMSDCGTTTDVVVVHGVDKGPLRKFRDFSIPQGDYAVFETDPGSAIVGASIARKYGWKKGDQVTLPKLRGIGFNVAGIFDAGGSSLDEIIMLDRTFLGQAVAEPDRLTMLAVLVGAGADPAEVAERIDATFANSSARTKTTPERGFIQDLVSGFGEMVGFARLVARAALILLLAVIANSVSMGMRDRAREIAIMKLMGYESGMVLKMLTSESALTGLAASVSGVLAAWAILGAGNFSISVEGFTLYPRLPLSTAISAVVIGTALCSAGAWVSARRAAARPIVAALKEVD